MFQKSMCTIIIVASQILLIALNTSKLNEREKNNIIEMPSAAHHKTVGTVKLNESSVLSCVFGHNAVFKVKS